MNKALYEKMNEIKSYYLGDAVSIDKFKKIIDEYLDHKSNNSNHIDNTSKQSSKEFILDLELLKKNALEINANYNLNLDNELYSNRKYIGNIIIFFKRVIRKMTRWYFKPVIDMQLRYNIAMTSSYNDLINKLICIESAINNNAHNFLEKVDIHNIINHKEDIKRLKTDIIDFKDSLINQDLKIYELEKENDYYKNKILQVLDSFEILNNQTHNNQMMDHYKVEMENIKTEYVCLKNQIDTINLEYSKLLKVEERNDKEFEHRLDLIESNYNYLSFKFNNKHVDYKSLNSEKTSMDFYEKLEESCSMDYFLFENKFRGTEKNIKSSQQKYIQFFRSKDNILDVGCGRGEFLELLRENGIKAKGIDTYSDYIYYCRDKGLDVENMDVIQYLHELEDNSLGGIFLGQVIEHLQESQIVDLVNLAYKKLQNGCYFVAETPNPTMLTTFSNSFYLDISHNKPVHPETIKFLATSNGFKDVRIIYSSEIDYKLPLLSGKAIDNLAEFNDGLNLLNKLLFGAQDYAIAAKK